MKLRASLIVSLQNIVARILGSKLKAHDVKFLMMDRVSPILQDHKALVLAGKLSKEAVDFMTRQIKAVEDTIEGKIANLSGAMPLIVRVSAINLTIRPGRNCFGDFSGIEYQPP